MLFVHSDTQTQALILEQNVLKALKHHQAAHYVQKDFLKEGLHDVPKVTVDHPMDVVL